MKTFDLDLNVEKLIFSQHYASLETSPFLVNTSCAAGANTNTNEYTNSKINTAGVQHVGL